MIQFSLLGSGSAGNATFVRGPRTKLLIDNGLSLKQLQLRLDLIGESLDGLTAIAITHEHSDHIAGLRTLTKKFPVPVFATRDTAEQINTRLGEIPNLEFFDAGDTLEIGDLALHSFSVEHDAADPVSFSVSCGDSKLGMATDLGHVTDLVRQRLSGSHALVLESNYCPDMIQRSSYPMEVVQRIRSKRGHLSNQDMNKLLNHLLHDELQLVVAIHVSQENNTADKARTMAQQAMRGHAAKLFVAAQDAPSPLFAIEPGRVLERTA